MARDGGEIKSLVEEEEKELFACGGITDGRTLFSELSLLKSSSLDILLWSSFSASLFLPSSSLSWSSSTKAGSTPWKGIVVPAGGGALTADEVASVVAEDEATASALSLHL